MELSMGRELMSIKIKILILDGGNLARRKDKVHIHIVRMI